MYAAIVVFSIVIPFAIWCAVARYRDIRAEREAEVARAAAMAALPFDEVSASAYVVPTSGIIPVAQEVIVENPLPFDATPTYTRLPFEGEPVAVEATIRSRRRARRS